MRSHSIESQDYEDACCMAGRVTESLAGAGLWGVDFLLTKRSVHFSELSPRPHDTGMVTLADITALREIAMQVASKVTVKRMD